MKNTDKSLRILGMVKRYHHNHDHNQQVLTSRNIQARRILAIAAALSIVVIYQTGLLTDADALTRYYNCTTRAANKNGSLSLQNADTGIKVGKNSNKQTITTTMNAFAFIIFVNRWCL
jgi:hypothetical protein